MERDTRHIDFNDVGNLPVEDPRTAVRGLHPHLRYIDVLAKQVRTIYCVCYRQLTGADTYGDKPIPKWDGGTGQFGDSTTPIWPKIAAAIVELKADPVSYIRAQFRNVKNPTRPPMPNQMYNPEAVRRWEEYRLNAAADLRNKVASDLNQIQIHVLPLTRNLDWEETKALDYVLRDTGKCKASSLIRYCVAVTSNLPVALEFRELALLQYMFQIADYDELLGNRIPADLRDEAEELRRRLLGP